MPPNTCRGVVSQSDEERRYSCYIDATRNIPDITLSFIASDFPSLFSGELLAKLEGN
jgi:hypothetical protein